MVGVPASTCLFAAAELGVRMRTNIYGTISVRRARPRKNKICGAGLRGTSCYTFSVLMLGEFPQNGCDHTPRDSIDILPGSRERLLSTKRQQSENVVRQAWFSWRVVVRTVKFHAEVPGVAALGVDVNKDVQDLCAGVRAWYEACMLKRRVL